MVTNPHGSIFTNPMNLRIMLQSTTRGPSFGIQLVSTFPPINLLLVDLFDLFLMSWN
jgi:hypothetical protein